MWVVIVLIPGNCLSIYFASKDNDPTILLRLSIYAFMPKFAEASYNLDYSRVRAYCACSRCGWGLFGHFFSHLSFLSSFSFSLGDGPI